MFRSKHPLAWEYHRNTSRWFFNIHGLPEDASVHAPFKEYLDRPSISLPAAQLPPSDFRTVIEGRLSCRSFADRPTQLGQLATLLHYAYGVGDSIVLGDDEFLERPVPSGGGLYPLELYTIVFDVEGLEAGVYHYASLHHLLEQVRAEPIPRSLLSDLFIGQPYAMRAGVLTVITAVVERSLWKYLDRGYRYILMEAGHVAQNWNLVATALGLGSLNLGGFFDQQLAELLMIDPEQEIPVYGIATGAPATKDRTLARDIGAPAHSG